MFYQLNECVCFSICLWYTRNVCLYVRARLILSYFRFFSIIYSLLFSLFSLYVFLYMLSYPLLVLAVTAAFGLHTQTICKIRMLLHSLVCMQWRKNKKILHKTLHVKLLISLEICCFNSSLVLKLK